MPLACLNNVSLQANETHSIC
ncbi:hypothetical protein C354_04436 [Cryptococcus neoformans MW-RSA1955]|nr:hypothetical protein C354_04436 [Cryptococcus neoformans var. grubii MW-RSA1955]